MQISEIKLICDSEKLCVLRRYVRDEGEPQTSLEAFLKTLYEKNVPLDVRESIEDRIGQAERGAKKPPV